MNGNVLSAGRQRCGRNMRTYVSARGRVQSGVGNRVPLDAGGREHVVTPLEWVVSLLSLLLVLAIHDTMSAATLRTVIFLLALFSFLMVCSVGRRTLRTGRIGHFFIYAGVFLTYWVGLFKLSLADPIFSVREWQIRPFIGDTYPLDLVATACTWVVLLQFSALVGLSLGVPRAIRALGYWRWDRPLSRGMLWLLGFLALCSWLPTLLAFGGSISKVVARMVAMRSGQGPAAGAVGLWGHLSSLGKYGTAAALVALITLRGRRPLMLVVAAALGVLYPLLHPTRHHLLFVLLPLAIYLFRVFIQKGTRKQMVLLATTLLIFALAYQLQSVLREQGWQAIGSVEAESLLQVRGTDHSQALLFCLILVPERHDYFCEPIAPYFVTHFIPRAWWPNKPYPKHWTYFNAQFTQGGQYNVTPSLVGQAHLNWGFLGVLATGLWLGWLTRVADTWLLSASVERQRFWLVWVGSCYGFLVSSHRIYYPLYFVYVVIGFMAMWLVTRRARAPEASSR